MIFYGPTFFAKLIFFPPKLFFGILEKGNLSEQKKIWREKNQLSKKVFYLSKNNFPIFYGFISLEGMFLIIKKSPSRDFFPKKTTELQINRFFRTSRSFSSIFQARFAPHF
jgi:hypothetical protein